MKGVTVSGYAVEPDELARVSSFAVAAAASARDALQELRTEAESFLGTRWRGAAASAYRAGWTEWLAGAGGMLAALEDMAALLASSGVGYSATDESVRVAASS